MIVRSPILLLSAANALAQCPRTRPMTSRRPNRRLAMESMRFVQQVGYWSHFDAALEVSSWPLARSTTLWEAHAEWRRAGLLLPDGVRGDLVVRESESGEPLRVGILLEVAHRLTSGGHLIAMRCDVLWGIGAPGGRASAERQVGWLRPRHGVRFVPWYEADDTRRLERAA